MLRKATIALVCLFATQTQAKIRQHNAGMVLGSYYGFELSGHRTASGERFNPYGFTCAHRTLPFGTQIIVTNPFNGRSVTVRVNDKGPFVGGRSLDLSYGAARAIGFTSGLLQMQVR